MAEDTTLGSIVAAMEMAIDLVEAYPDHRRPYADLYYTCLQAAPFLTHTQEKKHLLGQNTSGRLNDQFVIAYFSLFGITAVTVTDTRQLAHNPVVRAYSTGGGWGVKAPHVKIREMDTDTKRETLVHERYFINPFFFY